MTDERHSEQSISHHEYFRYSHGTITAERRDTLECRHRSVKAIDEKWNDYLATMHTRYIHTASQKKHLLIRDQTLFKSTEILQTTKRFFGIDSRRTEPNDS